MLVIHFILILFEHPNRIKYFEIVILMYTYVLCLMLYLWAMFYANVYGPHKWIITEDTFFIALVQHVKLFLGSFFIRIPANAKATRSSGLCVCAACVRYPVNPIYPILRAPTRPFEMGAKKKAQAQKLSQPPKAFGAPGFLWVGAGGLHGRSP